MKYWPYALPNLVSALVLFVAALAVFLGLEEVGHWSLAELDVVELTVNRPLRASNTGAIRVGNWEACWRELSSGGHLTSMPLFGPTMI